VAVIHGLQQHALVDRKSRSATIDAVDREAPIYPMNVEGRRGLLTSFAPISLVFQDCYRGRRETSSSDPKDRSESRRNPAWEPLEEEGGVEDGGTADYIGGIFSETERFQVPLVAEGL
jgi:hypothetical protein